MRYKRLVIKICYVMSLNPKVFGTNLSINNHLITETAKVTACEYTVAKNYF